MKKQVLLFLAAAVLLSGCATATRRTVQEIEIITPGVKEADCDMRTPKDRYRAITPDKVLVEKSRYDITVTCYKQDYITAVETISSKFSGTSVGNVVTGIIPGYFIDWNTGAMYEYPEKVEIEMKPLTASKDEIDTKIYEITPPEEKSPALGPVVDDHTIIVPGPDGEMPQEPSNDLPEEEKDGKSGDESELSPQFDLNENSSGPVPLKPEQEKPTEPAVTPEKKKTLGQDITIDDLEPKAGDEPQPIPLLKRISN